MKKLILAFVIALGFWQPAFAQSPTDFFKVAEWVDSSLEEFSAKLKEQFPDVMFKEKGHLEMLPEMVDDPYYWYLKGTMDFPQTDFESIDFVCVRLGEITHEFIVKRFNISGPGHVRNARLFVPATWLISTLSHADPFHWPSDAISRLACGSLTVEVGSGGLVPLREDVLSSMEDLFDDVIEKTTAPPNYPLGKHEYHFVVSSPTSKEHVILHEAEATKIQNFLDMFFRSYALFQGT